MQPNDGEDSIDSDIFILQEITEISSISSVRQDGLGSNRSKFLEETSNKNGKVSGKINLKRKKSISDQKYTNGNKYPKTTNHSGVELRSASEDVFKENVASTHSVRSSYMCYECGAEFDREDLLKGHLLDHSFQADDNTDLEDSINESQLMLGKTLNTNKKGNRVVDQKHSNSVRVSSNSKSPSVIKNGNKTLDPKHSNSMSVSSNSKSQSVNKNGNQSLVPTHSNSMRVSSNSKSPPVKKNGNQTLDTKYSNSMRVSSNSKSPSVNKNGNQTSKPKHSNSLSVSSNSKSPSVNKNGNQTLDPTHSNSVRVSSNSKSPSVNKNGNQTLDPTHSNSVRVSSNSKSPSVNKNGNQTLDPKHSNSMRVSSNSKSPPVKKKWNQTLDPTHSNSMRVSSNSKSPSVNKNGNQTLDPTHSNSMRVSSNSKSPSVKKNGNQTLDPTHSNSVRVSSNSKSTSVNKNGNQTSKPKHSNSLSVSSNSKSPSVNKNGNQTLDPTHSNSMRVSSNSKSPSVNKNGNQTLDPKHSNSMSVSSNSKSPPVKKNGNQNSKPKHSNSVRVSSNSKSPSVNKNGNQTLDPTHSNSMRVSSNSKSPSVNKNGNQTLDPTHSNSMRVSSNSKSPSGNKNGNQTLDPTHSNSVRVSSNSKSPSVNKNGNQTLDPTHSNSVRVSSNSKSPSVKKNGNQTLDPTHSNSVRVSSNSKSPSVNKNGNQTLDPTHSNSVRVSSNSKSPSVNKNGNQTLDPTHSNSVRVSSNSKSPSVKKYGNQTLDPTHSNSMRVSSNSKSPSVNKNGNQTLDPTHSNSISVSSKSKSSSINKNSNRSLENITENHSLDPREENQMEILILSEGSAVSRSRNETLHSTNSNSLKKSSCSTGPLVTKTGEQRLAPKSSESLKVVDLIVIDSENQTLDTNNTDQMQSSVNSGGLSMIKSGNLTSETKLSNNLSNLIEIYNGNEISDPQQGNLMKISNHPLGSSSILCGNQSIGLNPSNTLKRAGLLANSLLMANMKPRLDSNSMENSKSLTSLVTESLNRSNHMSSAPEGKVVTKKQKQTLDPKHLNSLKSPNQSSYSQMVTTVKQTTDLKSKDPLKISSHSFGLSLVESGKQSSDPLDLNNLKTPNQSADSPVVNKRKLKIDPKEAKKMKISNNSVGSLKRSGSFAGSLLMENKKLRLEHSKSMKNAKSFSALLTDSGNKTLDLEKANQMSLVHSEGSAMIRRENETLNSTNTNSLKKSRHSGSLVMKSEKEKSNHKASKALNISDSSVDVRVIDSGNQTLDPKRANQKSSVNPEVTSMTKNQNQSLDPKHSLKRSSQSAGSVVMKNGKEELDPKCSESLNVSRFIDLLMTDTGNKVFNTGHLNSLKSSSPPLGSSMIESSYQTLDSKKKNVICVDSEVSCDEIKILSPERIPDTTFSLPEPVSAISYSTDKSSTISRSPKSIEYLCQICRKKFKTHNNFAKHLEKHKKQEGKTCFSGSRNVEGASKDAEATANSEIDFRQVNEGVISKQVSSEIRTCLLTKSSAEVTIEESVKDNKLKSTEKVPLGNRVEYNGITEPQLFHDKSKYFPQGDCAVRIEGNISHPEKIHQSPSKVLAAKINAAKCKRADIKANIALKTLKGVSIIPLVDIAESELSDKDLHSKPFVSSNNSVCSLSTKNGNQPASLENSSKNVEVLVAKDIVGSGVSPHKVIPVTKMESNDKSVNSCNFVCEKDNTIKQRKNSMSKQKIKPYLCKVCGKRFVSQGNFLQHVKMKHGERCNSSGPEKRENFTECSGNLPNSLANSGQACITIEREDAAEKVIVDHIISCLSEVITGTENIPSGDNLGCIGREDKAAEKSLSGNVNMEGSSVSLPYNNSNTGPIILPNNFVDLGQVDAIIQRKDAAQDKIPLNLLGSNFPNNTSVAVNEAPENVVLGASMDLNSVSLPDNNNTTSMSSSLPKSLGSSEIVSTLTNNVFPVQTNTIESPYSCPICFKKLSKDYVKIHIRLHQGKPYSCDLCEKSYVTRSKLNRHISKCHSGNKNSLCESSVKKIQKTGEAVEASASISGECNVQVSASDVLCQNKLNSNEKNNDLVDRAILEKPNEELGNSAVCHEDPRLDPCKEKSNFQSKSIGKSDTLSNVSCNVPVESHNVQDKSPLDLDVVVVDTITKENEQNMKNIAKEKGSGNLSKNSVVHVVTID
ncbi:serine-rich adhesin for platelets-like [Palaemon carinicauda]|uniref:serine-rich adhesin for platelets-like n=1 Tax=Palaemon carinicauda TaxID=392227 RepID=UPI0035B64AB9